MAGAARRRALAALLLAGITVAALGRVVTHPFVNLDDKQYVTANPVVAEGLTPHGAAWAVASREAANWHPLTWLSHMTDVSLFGMRPGFHHATSLLLHAAAAAVLFLVLAAMTGAPGPALAVAALFALHPLHVESVAWVAERKDVLSGALFALTLGAWLGYARRPSPGRYAAAAALFALGLAAKPMLVTFPFLLLLLDWWPLGRLRTGGGSPGLLAPGRALLEKLPLLALSAAASWATLVAQREGEALAALADLAWPWRLANAAVSSLRYLGKALWPADLAVFYPHPGRSLSPLLASGAGAALLAATLLALAQARRRPWLALGWLWYLGMLVPVAGLVQVGSQAMADRYTYLPLTGIFVAAAWSAADAARRRPRLAAPLPAAAGALIALLAAASFRQAGHWRTPAALYEHALRATGGVNWFADANLAVEDLRLGRWEAAVERYRRSIAARGDIPQMHFNHGVALLNLGRHAEAREAYREALALQAGYPDALVGVAWSYLREGRLPEALARHRVALARPGDPKLIFNYAVSLAAAGHPAEAEEAYRAALAADPGFAAARNNLGTLLHRQGREREALEELRAAAALAPADREIRANLARVEASPSPRFR